MTTRKSPGVFFKATFAALLLAVVCLFAAPRPAVAQTGPATPVAQSVQKAEGMDSVAGAGDTSAGAEKSGPLDIDLGTALVTIIIFVVLLIVLRATAWKPIMQGLKSREQSIREGIEAAAKARADAERITRELEAKIALVQQEGARQIAQAKADAVKVADAIKAQAEADASQLRDRTLREIESAKQQALSEINNHAAELGTSIARKILQRDITAGDHARLLDESLMQLQAAK